MSKDSLHKPDRLGELITDIARLSPAKRALLNQRLKGSRANADEQRNPLNPGRTLIALQPQGDRRPFFCVHPLNGDVSCYINLIRHLGQDQPLYGLQARGLDGAEEPLADIKTIAARYVEQIRTIQSQGPYALGGYCLGGLVAFEMAQQLRASGEAVAMVALLETPTVKLDRARHMDRWTRLFPAWGSLPSVLTVLPSWLIGCLQLTPRQCFYLFRLRMRPVQARFAAVFRSWGVDSHKTSKVNFLKEMGDLFRWSEQHRKIILAHYEAMMAYKPQAYPGRLTLFRTRMQPLIRRHGSETGWAKLAAEGLKVRVVPGHHLVMLQEPHVRVLAKQLREELKNN